MNDAATELRQTGQLVIDARNGEQVGVVAPAIYRAPKLPDDAVRKHAMQILEAPSAIVSAINSALRVSALSLVLFTLFWSAGVIKGAVKEHTYPVEAHAIFASFPLHALHKVVHSRGPH